MKGFVKTSLTKIVPNTPITSAPVNLVLPATSAKLPSLVVKTHVKTKGAVRMLSIIPISRAAVRHRLPEKVAKYEYLVV